MLRKLNQIIKSNIIVVQNISYLSILQIINLGIPLIAYPYLVRVLGKENYGLVIYVQAIVGFLLILVNFGFNLSATKEISTNRGIKDKINEIVSSVFVIKGFLFLFTLGILFTLLNIFPQTKELTILFYLTMYLCLNDWIFPIWYFQGVEKMKYITLLNVLSRSIFLIFMFLLIKTKKDYLMFPIVNGIGAIIAGFMALYIIFFKEKVSLVLPSTNKLIYYLKESFPVFISNVSIKIYLSLNKVIIGAFLGMSDVAFYDLAEKIVNLLKAPQSILSQVLFPKISKERNLIFVKKLFNFTVLINIGIYIVMLFLIKPIVLLLGGQNMLPAIQVVIILATTVPLVAMSNIFGIQLLIVFGFNKVFSKVIISSGVFYIVLLFLLKFSLGFTIERISVVTVLTELFVVVFMYYFCLKNKLWVKSLTT